MDEPDKFPDLVRERIPAIVAGYEMVLEDAEAIIKRFESETNNDHPQ